MGQPCGPPAASCKASAQVASHRLPPIRCARGAIWQAHLAGKPQPSSRPGLGAGLRMVRPGQEALPHRQSHPRAHRERVLRLSRRGAHSPRRRPAQPLVCTGRSGQRAQAALQLIIARFGARARSRTPSQSAAPTPALDPAAPVWLRLFALLLHICARAPLPAARDLGRVLPAGRRGACRRLRADPVCKRPCSGGWQPHGGSGAGPGPPRYV